MGVSEDRGQKTEDGNVARMKPRGIRDNVANIKICEKRGGMGSGDQEHCSL